MGPGQRLIATSFCNHAKRAIHSGGNLFQIEGSFTEGADVGG
jgi:hypothetical protein